MELDLWVGLQSVGAVVSEREYYVESHMLRHVEDIPQLSLVKIPQHEFTSESGVQIPEGIEVSYLLRQRMLTGNERKGKLEMEWVVMTHGCRMFKDSFFCNSNFLWCFRSPSLLGEGG